MALAVVAFRHYPVLLGTAFLAYSFGLRHAVDAEHIAVIDNLTRKLMQEGKQPIAVGFVFSLGHSTIVVIGSVAIASSALALQHCVDTFRTISEMIGTTVSPSFNWKPRSIPSTTTKHCPGAMAKILTIDGAGKRIAPRPPVEKPPA